MPPKSGLYHVSTDRYIPSRPLTKSNEPEDSYHRIEKEDYLAAFIGGSHSYTAQLKSALKYSPPSGVRPTTFTPSDLLDVLSVKKRHRRRPLPNAPYLALDAPGLRDDFYLHLLDWSPDNILAVGLNDSVYLWNAATHNITLLFKTDISFRGGEDWDTDGCYIASLHFLKNNSFILVIGLSNGVIQLWDIFKRVKIADIFDAYQYGMEMIENTLSSNSMNPLSIPSPNRIATLSSSVQSNLLSAGSRFGQIRNYDFRLLSSGSRRSPRQMGRVSHLGLVSTLESHQQEVCGLQWSNEAYLASGGNDNIVNIWDIRNSSQSLHYIAKHKAAVKALGWCPWRAGTLATGGGSTDKRLCIWDASTGALIDSVLTDSQICSLEWSLLTNELVTAHGFAKNELVLWDYPHLKKVAHIQAHSQRVLQTVLSPNGETIVSAAPTPDEMLKFWKFFDLSSESKADSENSSRATVGSHITQRRNSRRSDFVTNSANPID